MSPYSQLATAVRTGRGIPQSWSAYLRDRQRRYEASRARKPPLGDGDMLVAWSDGRIQMMTREEYTQWVHVRKRKSKKSKDKDGAAMLHYDAHEGEVKVRFDGRALGTMDGGITDDDVDWIKDVHAKEEDDGYFGEF